MKGDGNGWVRCGSAHRHWGRFGAAGLLLFRAGTAQLDVLMQQRAAWTSEGQTWSIPGGARDSHESPVQAALREASEEAGIGGSDVQVAGMWRDDHRGWVYTTVIATSTREIHLTPNGESAELRWVRTADVGTLRLHPGFARTWPRVRSILDATASAVTS